MKTNNFRLRRRWQETKDRGKKKGEAPLAGFFSLELVHFFTLYFLFILLFPLFFYYYYSSMIINLHYIFPLNLDHEVCYSIYFSSAFSVNLFKGDFLLYAIRFSFHSQRTVYLMSQTVNFFIFYVRKKKSKEKTSQFVVVIILCSI